MFEGESTERQLAIVWVLANAYYTPKNVDLGGQNKQSALHGMYELAEKLTTDKQRNKVFDEFINDEDAFLEKYSDGKGNANAA